MRAIQPMDDPYEDWKDEVAYRQEALIRKLREEMEAIRTIPCMKCSLRGGRHPPLRNLHFQIPRAAIKGLENDRRSGVSGRSYVRGRGRASILKQRAHQARDLSLLPNPTTNPEVDTCSSVDSSLSSFRLGEFSEDGSRSSSPVMRGFMGSRTLSYGAECVDTRVGVQSLIKPFAASNCHWSSAFANNTDNSPSTFTGDVPLKGSSLWVQTNQADTKAVHEPELKQLNVESSDGKRKRRKTKFSTLDLREPYEVYQSELLVGIPAGAERGIYVGCTGFGGFDNFRLGSEEVSCMVDGYRPQVTPKVHSISEFPSLHSKRHNQRGEINFMNTVDNKKSVPRMKSIAAFIVNGARVDDSVPLTKSSTAEEEAEKGCVVIIDNIPEEFSEEQLKGTLEAYGEICWLTIMKTGKICTATVTMKDADAAQWVSEALDGIELCPDTDCAALSISVR